MHDLAQEPIAFPLAVSPCGIEKIAAKIDSQLHGSERFPIIRPGPSTHTPQPVSDLAYFEIRPSQLAILHDFVLTENSAEPASRPPKRHAVFLIAAIKIIAHATGPLRCLMNPDYRTAEEFPMKSNIPYTPSPGKNVPPGASEERL